MKKYIFIFAIMMCFCSCKEKFIELGNGYKLMSWDFGLMLVNQDRIVIVSDAITKYDFNDKFIIIKQKPFDLITKDIIQKQPFGKVVACFRHSKIRQYWIIRKD